MTTVIIATDTQPFSPPYQHYLENDQKLKKFVPIIKDSVVYPVLYDAKRTVLSLPPIINGAHSAVRNSDVQQISSLNAILTSIELRLSPSSLINSISCLFTIVEKVIFALTTLNYCPPPSHGSGPS